MGPNIHLGRLATFFVLPISCLLQVFPILEVVCCNSALQLPPDLTDLKLCTKPLCPRERYERRPITSE